MTHEQELRNQILQENLRRLADLGYPVVQFSSFDKHVRLYADGEGKPTIQTDAMSYRSAAAEAVRQAETDLRHEAQRELAP